MPAEPEAHTGQHRATVFSARPSFIPVAHRTRHCCPLRSEIVGAILIVRPTVNVESSDLTIKYWVSGESECVRPAEWLEISQSRIHGDSNQ